MVTFFRHLPNENTNVYDLIKVCLMVKQYYYVTAKHIWRSYDAMRPQRLRRRRYAKLLQYFFFLHSPHTSPSECRRFVNNDKHIAHIIKYIAFICFIAFHITYDGNFTRVNNHLKYATFSPLFLSLTIDNSLMHWMVRYFQFRHNHLGKALLLPAEIQKLSPNRLASFLGAKTGGLA